MIPSKQNSDNQITKIEIENEVKASRSKKKSNITTPVKIHEILKQSTEEHEGYVKTINEKDANKDAKNVQTREHDKQIKRSSRTVNEKKSAKKVVQEFHGGKKPPWRPAEFWVQFDVGGGDSSPLSYDPDRNTFVLLVFSLVAVMLTITAIFVTYVYYTDDLRQKFDEFGGFILIGSGVGLMFVNCTMVCSGCARVPPCSFFFLLLGVIFMSMLAAAVTVVYSTDIIFLAAFATIVTVVVCMCLACTSFDFTSYLLYVIAIAATFMALVLVISITQLVTGVRHKPLILCILCVGTLINVVMLIIQLQMILGGKSVELSEDDYALGALMLYMSIVDLFLKLMQIFGMLSDE